MRRKLFQKPLREIEVSIRRFLGLHKSVKITFDPAKRNWTLETRGLDFGDAAEVFAGETIDLPDVRFDYSEVRVISVGHLRGRMVIMVWTQQGDARRVISMRKANDREQSRYRQ